ncbi:hypothetical protein [Schinkia azotoformans]|uniref:hypothetical protein n=1 Tax=Schinkia azotoformans TaxID=1454 RepID=UPI002DBDB2AD|nr:hypothetical protein [Schinkia azotoformans]MEC1722272.1 hypothetical protein [Schinkia azotoformans]MED4414632.1 hypothetical protein [Schinkia azotoformans]
MKQTLWDRLRTKLFKNDEKIMEEPEEPQPEEITQTIEIITLQEQLGIFQQVDQYMKEYTPKYALASHDYEKGFAMKNDVFVSTAGEDPISRCNLEVFYQQAGTTTKAVTYLVSLIKFGGDEWKVFQVK